MRPQQGVPWINSPSTSPSSCYLSPPNRLGIVSLARRYGLVDIGQSGLEGWSGEPRALSIPSSMELLSKASMTQRETVYQITRARQLK
jgi:hypothetical protein